MLTVTCEPNVSEATQSTRNETLPSDLEISRRVLRIRSGWSLSERVQRRRDAESRFVDLLGKLDLEAA